MSTTTPASGPPGPDPAAEHAGGWLVAPGTMCLAVTSSTSVVGVAVGPAGAPAAEVTADQITTDRRHAEELTPLLRAVLARAGIGLDGIGCFVVDVGPGRFTGLRVGLTTVRSLALVGNRPVVALTSLEILAGAEPDRPLLAVVDARRGEVFQQRFGPDGPEGPALVGRPDVLAPIGLASPSTDLDPAGLNPAGLNPGGLDPAHRDPAHRDPAGLNPVGTAPAGLDRAGAGLVVVGDGADRYAEWYGPTRRPGREPSAAAMITLASRRWAVPGPQVAPVYLREPDVHINVKTRTAAP